MYAVGGGEVISLLETSLRALNGVYDFQETWMNLRYPFPWK